MASSAAPDGTILGVPWIVTIEGSRRDVARLVGAYPRLTIREGPRSSLPELVEAVDAPVGGTEVAEGVGAVAHLGAGDLAEELGAGGFELG